MFGAGRGESAGKAIVLFELDQDAAWEDAFGTVRNVEIDAGLQAEHPSIRSYGRGLLLAIEPRIEALAAERLGVDPSSDPRPAVFAGLWTAMVSYLFEHAGPGDDARRRAERWLTAARQLLDE